MRYLSILALILFTGVASAQSCLVQSVYVPQQIQAVYQPVQIQAVQSYGCAQGFAAQQFYAAPVQFQQAYGVQQLGVQRIQQFGHVQAIGVQRIGVQPRLGLNLNIGGSVRIRQGLFGSRIVIR